MLIFVDEYGKHHSALAEFKETKGVNGEKSLSGTIYTNEEILEGIGRGWRILWNNEQYCLSYVYPVDEGNRIAVEFDAVHEFFFDFKKTVIHSQLDGSNTMQAYLDFIFNGSGYVFNLEVNVNAFEKESFGFKNRLDLFKDIIQSTGVEYTVSGKVVRILKEVGTDLSTVVRKGFNMNELTIEKDAGSFITYKKGYGAFFDEDDHSQGRLEVEYLSPLSEIYGILEGDPIVDERYKNAENFETRLQNEVESSYNVSVNIDMEDLTKAGYQYEQPHAGDYIMAINDDLNFRKRIRIMSYETEYDTQGNIVKHDVSCGSESIASKMTSSDSNFRKDIQAGLENAINTANQALVSADGKSILNFGPDEPLNPSVGDTWYKVVGEKTIMQVWNGYEWIDPLDFSGFEEAIKDIEEEIVVMTGNINTAVDNANQAVEDAGFSKTQAQDAKSIAVQASADVVNIKATADQAMDDASTSLTNSQNALNKAIKASVIHYALSTNGTIPPTTGWQTSNPNPTADQYVWTRTTITLNDNSTIVSYSVGKIGAKGDQGLKGDTGEQGPRGLTGAQGKGISSTLVQYNASSSGTTEPTGTWSNTIPTVSDNQYLWTKTTLTYTDGQTTTAYSVGKMGAQGPRGPQGSTGATGEDGTGISSTSVTYQAGSSGTTEPTGTWSATVPNVADNQYLWTRIITSYTDGSSTTAYSVGKMGAQGPQGAKGDTGPQGPKGATGSQGPKGDTGVSVSGVIEQYLATSASSGVTASTSGWTTTIQTLTASKKYLWNYEIINFSDGSSSPTVPVIIGVYGDKGDTGSTGATGRSITGITEYYLITNASSNVTRSTSGWTTTMQKTTPTNNYLWNYEKITWSSGTTTTYVEPIIIGIHGEKGDTGAQGPQGPKGDTGAQGAPGVNAPTITSVAQQFYLSTSKTTQTGGSWLSTVPVWSSGKYYWTRVVTTYSNGVSTPSTPVLDNALNDSLVTALEVKTANQDLSTTVSQHATLIEGKANSTTVDAIAGRVTTAEGSISTIAGEVELKANSTDVQALTGRVSTAEGKITTQAGQIALKANQSVVDTLTGRVSTTEAKITATDGKVTTLTTKTDGNTTQIGSLQSSFSGLNSTVATVRQDLDGLEIGGRNLYTNTSKEWASATFGGWQHYFHNISIGENENLNVGDQITWSGLINPESQTGGIMAHFDISGGGHVQRMSNFISRGTTRKVSGTTIVPENAIRLRLALRHESGATPSQVFNYKELKIEKGNKATDWTPAPEDMATVTQFSSLEQTVNGIQTTVADKEDKTVVDALADQWSTTTALANGHTSQISSLGDMINLRLTQAQVDASILDGKRPIEIRQTTDDPPTWYTETYGNQTVYELKNATALGLGGSGTLETIVSSITATNGSMFTGVKQTYYQSGGKVFTRTGEWSAQWSSWSEIANTSNVVAQINLSTEGVLIAGNKVRITGQTSIDNGVIKRAMIGDLEVSGAKIADATISSAKIISLDAGKITAGMINTSNITIGTATSGKRVNITGAGLIAHDNNGRLRVKLGVQDLAGDGQSDPSTLVFYTGNGTRSASIGTNTSDNFIIGTQLTGIYTMLKSPTQIIVETNDLRFDVGNSSGPLRVMNLWNASTSRNQPHIFTQTPNYGVLGRDSEWFSRAYVTRYIGDSLYIGQETAPQLGHLVVTAWNNTGVVQSYSIWNRTTSGDHSVVIGPDGSLKRQTSARKYKTDIQTAYSAIDNAKKILQIQPVSWLDKRALESGELRGRDHGFIADEFDQLGLNEVVLYVNGEVDGLAYDKISMYHNVILSDHENQLKDIKNENAQLLGEINMLRNEVESLRQLVA